MVSEIKIRKKPVSTKRNHMQGIEKCLSSAGFFCTWKVKYSQKKTSRYKRDVLIKIESSLLGLRSC